MYNISAFLHSQYFYTLFWFVCFLFVFFLFLTLYTFYFLGNRSTVQCLIKATPSKRTKKDIHS